MREPREKSDDPFMDEYLASMDRVQDLNLVRAWRGRRALWARGAQECPPPPVPHGVPHACPACDWAPAATRRVPGWPAAGRAIHRRPAAAGCERTCSHRERAARAACRPQKAEEVAQEKNRALKAAMNAELRKTKASMLEVEVPALAKLVKKGKNLSQERIQERLNKVRAAGRRRAPGGAAADQPGSAVGLQQGQGAPLAMWPSSQQLCNSAARAGGGSTRLP